MKPKMMEPNKKKVLGYLQSLIDQVKLGITQVQIEKNLLTTTREFRELSNEHDDTNVVSISCSRGYTYGGGYRGSLRGERVGGKAKGLFPRARFSFVRTTVPGQRIRSKNSLIDLMRFWNSLPHTQHHMDPNAKVFKNAIKTIRKIKSGKLFKSVPESFLRKWNIPRSMVERKWTLKEIQTGMFLLNRCMSGMYHPKLPKMAFEKSILNKPTKFNRTEGTSWFLCVMSTTPKPIQETREVVLKYPKATELVIKLLPRPGRYEKQKIVDGVSRMAEIYELLMEKDIGYNNFVRHYPGFLSFVNSYVDMAMEYFRQHPVKYTSQIVPGSKIWKLFVEEVKQRAFFGEATFPRGVYK